MAVPHYLKIVASVIVAELLRRFYNVLVKAFTGPLSIIPGPVMNKLSALPYMISLGRGKSYIYTQKLHEKYGPLVRIGPNEVSVADKALMNKVIVEWDLPKAVKIHGLVNMMEPTGISIVTETNKANAKQRRRSLSHGFSTAYLKGVEPLMISCLSIFREVLDKACLEGGGSAILDMYGIISGLTFDVMSEASFGGSFEEVRHLDNPPNSVKAMIVRLLTLMTIHAAIPFAVYIPWIIPPLKVPELDKTLEFIIQRRRTADKDSVRRDLLQIFLDAHKEDPASFTERDIYSEMKFFTIAGADTSSTTITFALEFLLDNPAKLEALVKEIDDAIPSLDTAISSENTRNLPYVNAVIHETLRLRPPTAGGIHRETLETVTLGGYLIPANTQITASHYALQHSPTVWTSPDTFIPERWLPDPQPHLSSSTSTTSITSITSITPADPNAFFSFSAGSRVCIGKAFALLEMRLLLVTLIRHYELRKVEGQDKRLENMFVLHFRQGKFMVDVRKRTT